ncbi:methyltransferase domain-containing protein [Candidatus Bathyarchaeota archaeon]|nr:MAG: methyltransferase domain-containing protein [Candidatus Bathyarchaeota archaeon]
MKSDSVRAGMKSLDSAFYAHYESGVEKDRLLTGSSNLEFYRTKEIISRFLPKKPATILDVGGGPGRYSFWLAGKGHRVHLVDILPLHVKQAGDTQRKSNEELASISLGDARELDFHDKTMDIVLLFGPLYHLVQRRERMRALLEARRVLKPGGRLFVAAVSRFTSALDGSLHGYIEDPAFMKIIKQDLKNGQHRNPRNVPEYFTTAFFHHPKELEAEISKAGFRSVRTYALTGFAWLLPRFNEYWKDRELRGRLLTLLERTESEPSLMGVSDHLLATGNR